MGRLIYSQSVNLPLDHWAYDFIERMEAKEFLHSFNNDIQPVSRNKFIDYILELEKYKKNHPDCFSKIEDGYFQRLKGEFSEELSGQKVNVKKNFYEPHFYALRRENDSQLFIDLLAGNSAILQCQNKKSKAIYQPYYGAIVRGSYNNIHFYSDNRVYSEWGGEPYIQHYNASQGYPVNTNRDSTSATWDVSKSYFCFSIKKINFLLGRENVKWGPSHYGSLMFSGLSPDFDQLQLTINFNPFTFVWLHGSLRSTIIPKWISSHRLAISLTEKIDIGLQESVIYGDRDLEPAYLNPIIPYLIAEHTLGDKDNVSLGFDYNVNLGYGLKMYGEFFIDDLFAPWELFSNYWGNKFALNFGTLWVDPFRFSDSDIRVEYFRIEPYVYTHKNMVNIFENYNIGLGSFLEPNSDCLIFEFRKFLNSFFYFKMKYYHSRHGEGDRREPHQESDSDRKKFLAGTIENYNKTSTGVSGELKRDLRFNFDIAFVKADNHQNIDKNDKNWWELFFEININW